MCTVWSRPVPLPHLYFDSFSYCSSYCFSADRARGHCLINISLVEFGGGEWGVTPKIHLGDSHFLQGLERIHL